MSSHSNLILQLCRCDFRRPGRLVICHRLRPQDTYDQFGSGGRDRRGSRFVSDTNGATPIAIIAWPGCGSVDSSLPLENSIAAQTILGHQSCGDSAIDVCNALLAAYFSWTTQQRFCHGKVPTFEHCIEKEGARSKSRTVLTSEFRALLSSWKPCISLQVRPAPLSRQCAITHLQSVRLADYWDTFVQQTHRFCEPVSGFMIDKIMHLDDLC